MPWFFLAIALPMGVGCALLNPIGLVVDEPEHIARADGLLLGQIMGSQPVGQSPGVRMNLAIFAVAVSELRPCITNAKMPDNVRKNAEAIAWTKDKLFSPTQMVYYFPTFYVPAALGLRLGRALGLTPLHTVFFARLCALLVFLGLGATALAVARHGTAFLFALLTLPTTINLAGSFNQDGLIIASAALAAALLTRTGTGVGRSSRLGAFGLLELITLAKLPYAPLFLICLLPLKSKNLPVRLLILGLALGPPLVWLVYLVQGHFSPWPSPAYHPGRLWPGSRSVLFHSVELKYNLQVLAAQPLQIIWLPIRSFARDWVVLYHATLALLAWYGLPIWRWEFPSLSASLIIAFLGSALKANALFWRLSDHMIVAVAVLLTFLAVYISTYISFDRAGTFYITGVSGRYFLPFLPFCIFLLPRFGLVQRGLVARVPEVFFALPAMVLAAVNIVALPWAIFDVFGMPGP